MTATTQAWWWPRAGDGWQVRGGVYQVDARGCTATRLTTMKPSEEPRLAALLAASRKRDAGTVAAMWRELTPVDQEKVLFTLLGMQSDVAREGEAVASDESPHPP